MVIGTNVSDATSCVLIEPEKPCVARDYAEVDVLHASSCNLMNPGRFCVFERKIERKVCIQTGFDFVCFHRTYTQAIAYWDKHKL